jgi:hypothetical protein
MGSILPTVGEDGSYSDPDEVGGEHNLNAEARIWRLFAAMGLALSGCSTGAPAAGLRAPETEDTCPVSLPNVTKSPDEHYVPTGLAFQNADGTIFTTPWPNGEVVFEPGGPGTINPDGSMSMKWPWYRTVPGEVVIHGLRLDRASAAMPAEILRGPADGYGEIGFHPSILTFPTEGCWQITARVGDATLTFVTRVVQRTD